VSGNWAPRDSGEGLGAKAAAPVTTWLPGFVRIGLVARRHLMDARQERVSPGAEGSE
jgi:hypothetical protein